MNIIFSDQEFPKAITKTIFLAGSSPRDPNNYKHWRHDMIEFLASTGYDGTVYIPIPEKLFRGGTNENFNYDDQVEWEETALYKADVILFWVERTKESPAITTNFELGEFLHSGKLFYGRPDDSDKIRYTDKKLHDLGYKIYNDMSLICQDTVKYLGDGSKRVNGETSVPLTIWNSQQFKLWYKNVLAAGNVLCDFKVQNYIGNINFVFSFTALVDVYITNEKRHKNNESIFNRTETSYICTRFYDHTQNKRYYVLVREFRSPVNNSNGYVYELPGGSSFGNENQLETASKELHEEIGLKLSPNRFSHITIKQPFATMNSNMINLYLVDLNKNEFSQLVNDASTGKVFGENEEEQITLHIVSEDELLSKYPIDYTNLGMIYHTMDIPSSEPIEDYMYRLTQ